MSSKMESEEDFLVGGRSFGLWLSTFCLFATWFGAGTLIAATDEVAVSGLSITALEPYGAGLCLILGGLFFAKPLWELKLLTYADFFRSKFGVRVEALSVFLNIPVYVGWIAVQIVSLANILAVFFPIPVWGFMIIITILAFILTVSGGMWSVSVTDSFQLFIIVLGLVYLFFKITGSFPGGFHELWANVPMDKKILIPHESFKDVFGWFGVLSISALGNMTGQDLGQRMFSARSAKVAQLACLLAGFGYIIFGSIPVFLGLTVGSTIGEDYNGSIIPNLIKLYLDPISGVILTLTIISAVVSTITSALLAPASMISNNFLKYRYPEVSHLKLCQWSVLLISVISLITAFMGENVYGLLETSYAVGFVGFFVPVTIGLFSNKLSEKACLISIILGIFIWSPEFFGHEDLPYSLIAVLLGYPIYFIAYYFIEKKSAI